MASIALGLVGAAIGGAVGGPGGARLGFSVGAAVGGIVDSVRQNKRQDVGRLSDVPFSGSSYGVAIPQVWGRYGRIPCNIIWGGDLVESSKDQGSKLTGTSTRQFSYTATFAFLICQGPVTRVRRIWAQDILIYDDSLGTGAGSETQQISVGSNTSGAFSIEFGGSTTASIAYNAAAATVQSALEALPSIGAGNILVTGSAGGPWTATFTGTLAAQNVARMDMHDGTLSGGSGQGIHTVQQGGLKYDLTIYTGTSTQAQDPTMVAALGAANTPAYRNRCYVVAKNFPLALWGNSISNLNLLCEVERYGALAALVTDSFNRADGAIGVADSGQTWQQAGTSALITGNKCRSTAGTQAYIDCGQSDVTIQLTMANRDPVNGSTRIIARFLDTNNYLYWGENATTSTYQIVRKQGGLFTTLLDSGITPANGDVLKLVLSGSTLQGYRNGSLIATATSTFQQTRTEHGFGSPEDFSTADDFSVFPNAANSISLAEILTDLFTQEGLIAGQYDVTAATDKVDGFALLNRAAVRDIADLLAYYNTLLVEVDGQIRAVKRGGAVVLTVAEGDLAARIFQADESDVPPKVRSLRLQELELPFRIDVGYLSSKKDYEQASQGAVRYTKPHVRDPVTINTGLALRDDGIMTAETKARQVAERLLYQTWTERETFEFSLGPRYLQLAPGDVILLPHAGNTFRVRIQQMDVALPGPINFTAVLDDAATLVQEVPGGDVVAAETAPSEVTDTLLVVWSGNALVNADAGSVGVYAAATGNGTGFWGGAALYWSRDGGDSFLPLSTITTPSTIGTATSVLAPGAGTGLWDDTNTVDVTVISGTAPASTSDAAILSGDNAFLIGDEVIQAGVVTALGGSSYRLSHLLRGHRGTDGVWSEHLAGERFVPLSSGLVTRIELGADMRGRRAILKAVSNGQAIDDAEEISVFVSGREYFTWAPYLVTATRNGPLDILIVWNRRTRTPAGLSDYVDESLGEAVEAYTVTVLANAPKTITAITQAATPTVSAAAHGFSNGDVVLLNGLKGMTQLNGKFATVSGVTGGTFVIDQATDLFDAYVSGGTAEKVIRTINVSTQATTYTIAQQTTDWGSAQATVKVFVQQVGFYEAGYGTTAVV